jgi:hypothetical protein
MTPLEYLAQVPLAGDLVSELTHRLGVDRAAFWLADKIGVDCGCPQRQELLNRLDAKLRRRFGMLVPGTEVSAPPTKE